MILTTTIAFGGLTSHSIAQTGFYSSSREMCHSGSGTLKICDGAQCRSFSYQEGAPISEVDDASGLAVCDQFDALFNAIIPDDLQLGSFQPPALEISMKATEVSSAIPMRFNPPDRRARIEEVIPVYLRDDDQYPALFVFWAFSQLGGKVLPLQVLVFDDEQGAYVDGTRRVYAGRVPLIDFPRNAAVLKHAGRTTIVVANQGHDGEPFTLALPALITTDQTGKFIDLTDRLLDGKQFYHDTSAGVINKRGDVGIFLNSAHVAEFYVMKPDNSVVFDLSRLPPEFRLREPNYLTSAMTDVDGDGHVDLVLGKGSSAQEPSYLLLNDGNGYFNKRAPIQLPFSALPFTEKGYGPGVVAIEPTKLSNGAGSDLLVTSTRGDYSGYEIQLISLNDDGVWADLTEQHFNMPSAVYRNLSRSPYSWAKRIRPFETSQGTSFITQADANVDTPSFFLRNDGSNKLEVGGIYLGRFITNAAMFGGEPMLITVWGWNKILLDRLPAANSIKFEHVR